MDVGGSCRASQRTFRNTLIFVAPDEPSLGNARQVVGKALAWRSIVNDERLVAPFDAGNVTAQHEVMALTPAEKQRRYRQRQSALVRSRPDAVEAELLQQFERCEHGELGLSDEQRLALADKLADLARLYLGRAQELGRMAQKVRYGHINDKVKLSEEEIQKLSPMRRPIVNKPLGIPTAPGSCRP